MRKMTKRMVGCCGILFSAQTLIAKFAPMFKIVIIIGWLFVLVMSFLLIVVDNCIVVLWCWSSSVLYSVCSLLVTSLSRLI